MNKFLIFGAAIFLLHREWQRKLTGGVQKPVTDGSSSTDPLKTVDPTDVSIMPVRDILILPVEDERMTIMPVDDKIKIPERYNIPNYFV